MGKYVERINIQHGVFPGALWFIGWLFTIGFAGLSFWHGVLAFVIWPFYLGQFILSLL